MNLKLLNLINLTNFLELFNKLGYTYYTKGDYNLNIIGIRNLLDGNVLNNTFNDALVVEYKKDGKPIRKIWEFTTDPGLTMLKAPMSSLGTAILKTGLYKGVYKIDLHKGKYRALCQRLGPVTVYRDNNRDNMLDMNESKTLTGSFGINIHRAKDMGKSEFVNNWSAGCQVVASSADFNCLMQLSDESAKRYSNSFTYTLVDTNQILENM